ncbi:MAG: SpoIIE family protein phosphatase [Paracoccaceae bacterium]
MEDFRPEHDVSEDTSEGCLSEAGSPTILIADDSRLQRKLLATSLKKWGYTVIEAGSGQEALALARANDISMVISDWMMPGMSGPEFCRAFRALDRSCYGYFVLLTSKAETQEIAEGLNSGADDFLTKPVNPGELRARLRAGERIVEMQAQLVEQNRLVNEALDKIQVLYASLDRDLEEAKKLQQSLLRETHVDFGQASASFLLQPSGHVGGDLVGYFKPNARSIGLYSLDVSGHGVTSALMTARIAGHLSGRTANQNLAIHTNDAGDLVARDPAETAALLNDLLLDEFQTDHYFTLALCILDLPTGQGRFVQAGHPHPFLKGPGAAPRTLGAGGLPVGLVADPAFESVAIDLSPGDRLVLYSDGITECEAACGSFFGEDRLAAFLEDTQTEDGPQVLNGLVEHLRTFSSKTGFDDDISAIVFDYTGSGPDQT